MEVSIRLPKSLRRDVESRVQPYLRQVGVALTQNQVDAIVSFVFNVGGGNFSQSTLLRELNRGNLDAVPNEIRRWDQAGGVVQPGLTRRRNEEAELFGR